ncbi:hypothetical protein MCOR02_004409 [Pyricularia oryzae]|uniref:RRM domain-containing protein n=2 Tax=Pyricularia oryzae TaxID=318829 RepID=G4MMX6_PYRO7|nr:uncharacterized protein MGG_06881 [Pyricularia oryzae 70-15]KAH9435476.1 hypothetical protein MCOR02_004409 [Pyricularia oryzae]EHA56998.1 hypothetical protein MGG_06881 [Pyricularia oryzae 70-15]KAI6255446.1 hypothetical protein MCOR19_008057 [Pyricularia oryzae]KAI6321884.1 hypothetical protein MCOR34_002465 [Pyricularia oryzae]KAI6374698.1 hypothetical protein MCOR31_002605 [Pyricularia oryzae]
MTEPEAFEDDLFADLYADDAPTEPAKVPEKAAAPTNPTPAPVETREEQPPPIDQSGHDDSNMGYDEDEEEEDDVDFNLGNGTSSAPNNSNSERPLQTHAAAAVPPQPAAGRGPNSKEDGKMFIGGLNWETTDESLRDYFSQFGEVIECTVMRDGTTGRSRGFGFLTFKDPKTVNIVMVKEHYLDGKIIDPKRAIPRDEQEKTSKIFVGGVSQETTDQEFKDFFAQFGRVVDATLMMDKDTGRPRGFGFVTFESEAGVEACLARDLEIHGKLIEVKKAQPRGNLREEEEANRRNGGPGNKFRKQGEGQADASGAGNPAAGGMTPQMMANYWQRMQQYFQMMQQQMAMQQQRNMGFQMNPQMMQMMQMQQMMGRGGPNGQNPMAAMAAMNPQMMQQMQQMMGQQGGGPGGMPGGGPGGDQSGEQDGEGDGNRAPFNAYDQQSFEEQKYNNQHQQQRHMQQQQQRGGFGGPQQQHPQQQMQQGGYNNQPSYEGMYDDVPQANNFNQGGRGGFRQRGGHHNHFNNNNNNNNDPANAPPPNAPTGPKNAGKPGSNYRGGGRGMSRGFHPYARG